MHEQLILQTDWLRIIANQQSPFISTQALAAVVMVIPHNGQI